MSHLSHRHESDASRPQGLETLRRFVAELPPIQTVALGGIGREQVEAVLACGVGSVIIRAPNWRQATSAPQSIITAWERHHDQ